MGKQINPGQTKTGPGRKHEQGRFSQRLGTVPKSHPHRRMEWTPPLDIL